MKKIISVTPRLEVTVEGDGSESAHSTALTAFDQIKALPDETLAAMVLESLESQPARCYPLDFSEVLSEE